MTIKRYTYLIIYIIASVFFAACTSEEEQEPNGYGKNIKAKVSLATRATGTPEDAANNQELINDWWVLFVNNTGEIVKYIDRASTTKLSTAVEREEFDLEIATGDYTAYSFANITKTQVETAINTSLGGTHSLTAGQTMPDLTNVTFDVSSFNGAPVPPTTNIPMTGRQSVRFASGGMQFIELEVIRMLAKMEFQYKNISSNDLIINSLSIKQVQKNSVPLLPNYTWLNDGWTFADQGITASIFTRNYATPISVTKGNTTPVIDKFYMIESQADVKTPSQSYLMTLNVTRNSETNNLYFSLNKDKIQTIYRNDHVIIPLNIFDYIVSLDANFYPPIGGYPAIIKEDKDKDEFYITFKTQGEFEILPTVYNASTGTNVYYPHWDYNSTTVTVTGDDIFTVPPHIDTTTGELLGKLSTAIGTAIIDVEIKVEVSSGVWQVYPRRIYIIRSNT